MLEEIGTLDGPLTTPVPERFMGVKVFYHYGKNSYSAVFLGGILRQLFKENCVFYYYKVL